MIRLLLTPVFVGILTALAVATPTGSGTLAAVIPDVSTPTTSSVQVQPAEPDPGGPLVDWAHVKVGDTMPESVLPIPPSIQRGTLTDQKRAISGPRLVLPQLGTALPLVVSQVSGGQMTVPEGDRVGWMASSKPPGSSHGVAVLAGHRDAGRVGQGTVRGAMYEIPDLDIGARIVVWDGSKESVYRVTHIGTYDRGGLPPSLMDHGGRGRIALVTCGGRLRMGPDGLLHWDQNLVVFGRLVR